jgi:hypothetical protein
VTPEGLAVDAAPAEQPDRGHAPLRIDAERAIAFGQFPSAGEALVHILAAMLRIEDQIAAALAPPQAKTDKRKE